MHTIYDTKWYCNGNTLYVCMCHLVVQCNVHDVLLCMHVCMHVHVAPSMYVCMYVCV